MSKKTESLYEIGKSIEHRSRSEQKNNINNPAICRAFCHVDKGRVKQFADETVFWLTNYDPRHSRTLANSDNHLAYYKNSKIGGELITHPYGNVTIKTRYAFVGGGYREDVLKLDIHNRTVFETEDDEVIDLSINNGDSKVVKYQTLDALLYDREKIKQKLEEERAKAEEEAKKEAERIATIEKAKKDREEAERKAKEARLKAETEAKERAAREEAIRKAEEAQRAVEEARRREEEERKKEEMARKRRENIAELEDAYAAANKYVVLARKQVRKDVSLRSQHILSPKQEEVKRSHIFDGVPLVIEGGPGTGKTTTMIQRIKFLISSQALMEYDNPLTEAQIQTLTNPSDISNNWVFFSPTRLLLHFLRDNMNKEELSYNDKNTVTIEDINGKLMLSYRFRNLDKDKPFKLMKRLAAGEETMILDPKKVVASYERFCIKEITKKMVAAYKLNTSDYSWHNVAVPIKAHCKRAENIKDMDALMRLVNSLEETYKGQISEIEDRLSNLIKNIAIIIQERILEDEEKVNVLTEIFNRWKEELYSSADDEDENDDEDEDTSVESQNIPFKPELFKNLKPLVRKLGLMKYDNKAKLSKRQKEIYDIIEVCLDELNFDAVGELAWFTKNYASICKGLANAVLNPLTRLYKSFRKQMLETQSSCYNKILLEKVVKKENKQLHPDELHMLVGFINRLVFSIYQKSKLRFNALSNNKYVQAYKEHAKYVIAIDEATDYSWLDYYLITSLRHYEFSSLTLCGDSMQGLSEKGILDWSELKQDLLPKLEVEELDISYRQSATLVDTARKMYFDSKGREASYHSEKRNEIIADPKPLAFVSDDEEEKVEWMARRIVEVFKNFGNQVPSIAIFVGDNEDVETLVEALQDQDCLDSIPVANCTDNRTCTQTKCVRIFRMREVKGMEFEVTFFYNIDTALDNASTELMRRYLYVGISRAATHLAAVFNGEEGNEEILKYFDRTAKNWRI